MEAPTNDIELYIRKEYEDTVGFSKSAMIEKLVIAYINNNATFQWRITWLSN